MDRVFCMGTLLPSVPFAVLKTSSDETSSHELQIAADKKAGQVQLPVGH